MALSSCNLSYAHSLLEGVRNQEYSWKARLPCSHVVGVEGEVDLLDFVGVGKQPLGNQIIFDTTKWPPTDEGFKSLLKHLQSVAHMYGTDLRNNGHRHKMC